MPTGITQQLQAMLQDTAGLFPFPALLFGVMAMDLHPVMPTEFSWGDLAKARAFSVLISLTLRHYQPKCSPAVPEYTKDVIKAFAFIVIIKALGNLPG